MRIGGRRKSAIFFLTFGICLVVLALALNVGWILLNWREVALLVLGIIFFGLIIAGLVLNTVEQVLRAGRTAQKKRALTLSHVPLGEVVRECVELARLRHGLEAEA